MIWYALISVALAPLAWLAAREIWLASTTKFVDDGTWRDLRRHEDLGFAIFHFLMLLMPILGFVVALVATVTEIFE